MQAIAQTFALVWNRPQWLNLLANALVAIALCALILSGAWWVSERPIFRIKEVSVKAAPGFELKHVSLALLQQQFAGYLKNDPKGNFFRLDLGGVREMTESVAWVRRARVRRIWPNRLEIGVEEHEALALWEDGRIVNTHSELFTAHTAEAEEDSALPTFAGPAGSERLVVSRFADLRRSVMPLDVYPVAINLSSRQAWSAQLSDGTRLMMGRDQGIPLDERVQRWVAAYPAAKAKLNGRPALVDLRYPNGFVVGEFTNVSDNRTAQ